MNTTTTTAPYIHTGEPRYHSGWYVGPGARRTVKRFMCEAACCYTVWTDWDDPVYGKNFDEVFTVTIIGRDPQTVRVAPDASPYNKADAHHEAHCPTPSPHVERLMATFSTEVGNALSAGGDWQAAKDTLVEVTSAYVRDGGDARRAARITGLGVAEIEAAVG